MVTLISEAHAKCWIAFEDLVSALNHPVRDFRAQLPPKEIHDEFDKYKIWAGNTGAAHSGKRFEISLDYRLREASFFKNQVLGLLKTLEEKVRSTASLVRNERKPFEEEDNEEDEDDAKASASDATEEDDEESEETPKSEIPRLLESIKFTIASLYRIPIRKPAPLDRLKHKTSLDSSSYQHFDVLYVVDKFKDLNPDLATRLGKAITRRRQVLRYREDHKSSLDTSRVASSRFTLRSKATTLIPGDTSLIVSDTVLDSTALYPPSVAESKSSMASSFAGNDLAVEVPPRPKGEDGYELDLFECPYCLITKNITTDRQWKKHVLEDLQPYICTYEDCDLYDHFFENRDAWFKHEAQHHRAKWFCNTDHHPEYDMETDFIKHMELDHNTTFDHQQFALIRDMFRQPSRSIEGTCNLCRRHSKRIKSHVSRHLQQMALFALP
ncbi:uncharacterized protein BDR25DRAFT_296597, partial [Lindgomyces ingoldianus]